MYAKLVKPALDRSIAAVLLTMLALPFIVVAIWIKLDSKGSVIFKQPRCGKGKKPFTVYKFRTMSTEAPCNMPTSSFTAADAYITRAGKIMRKLSIDELPQILNVLGGGMSIVGPRPVVLTETKLIKLRDKYGANSIKPGITGWAQVNGRDELTPAEKAKLDGFYASRVSCPLDLKIILMTVWAVISLAGHKEGYEQDPKANVATEDTVRLMESKKMSTKSPLISIVTPVYNAADFLSETIKTVQNQTYENWELLLVDDRSSDESVRIVSDARKLDKRIKLIRLKENSGAAKARNAGTEAAKGRFVAFLDADDLWKPSKLKKQIAFALKNDASFVFSSYQFADAKGKPVAAPVVVPKSINYKESLRNHIIWTSTVLIDLGRVPKELVMMPDVRRGQDAATWWQILRTTGVRALGMQTSLAYYRRTNTSLSANKLKAVKRTWYLYRDVEKLSLMRAMYSFCFYAYNAVRKRV